MQWYLKVLKEYVNFSGRAHRTEFWMFILINLLAQIAIGLVGGLIGYGIGSTGTAVSLGYGLVMLYALAVLLPSLGVTVRRLHDVGWSGWWVLVGIIPIINSIGGLFLLVLMVLGSEEGQNQYGPNPYQSAGASGGTSEPGRADQTGGATGGTQGPGEDVNRP